jgi:hypothetical protein
MGKRFWKKAAFLSPEACWRMIGGSTAYQKTCLGDTKRAWEKASDTWRKLADALSAPVRELRRGGKGTTNP